MIIKIQENENGSHNNQSFVPAEIPVGWAVVPEEMEIPDSFPFVDIETEGQIVVKMVKKAVPPVPPQPIEPTEEDDVNAMLIDHELRLTMLELDFI